MAGFTDFVAELEGQSQLPRALQLRIFAKLLADNITQRGAILAGERSGGASSEQGPVKSNRWRTRQRERMRLKIRAYLPRDVESNT
jgi:hypothetical protein